MMSTLRVGGLRLDRARLVGDAGLLSIKRAEQKANEAVSHRRVLQTTARTIHTSAAMKQT